MRHDSDIRTSDSRALAGLTPLTPLQLNDIHLSDKHTPVRLAEDSSR